MPDPTAEPSNIEEVLRNLGVTSRQLEEATANHTLELLLIEQLALAQPAEFHITDLATQTGMPTDQILMLWRSLGFPAPRPDERIFTARDVDMIRTVAHLLEAGVVEPDLAVQMSRVIGSSLARVASAQVDAIGVTEDEGGVRGIDLNTSAAELMPTMPHIMDYVWRRHMQAAARRRIMRLGDHPGEPNHAVVGFADLVGFTALSQQITAHELADVVGRFETIAYDTIGGLHGRVVKMIGDEVMFTNDDEAQAVDIALTLSELYGADESLSDVRVGLAAGPVLEREADLYGPVVNLASRIVGIAFPGSVVADQAMHDALADAPELVWRPLKARKLKDLGRVPLWAVRRAEEGFRESSARDRARSRRSARRDLPVP